MIISSTIAIADASPSFWLVCATNMVLFVGAMMSVDATLYEAADLDGANKWQQASCTTAPPI